MTNPNPEWRQTDIEDFAPTPARAHHAKSDQVRMARDVSVMFDELKALADKHAELHADRARLQAELKQAQRRWWHRLMGR